MVASREIYWATFDPPAGRRPVCILTRGAAAAFLNRLVVAQVTRTIRGTRSEVPVGRAEGLPQDSVISCDNIVTIRRSDLDSSPIGHLSRDKQRQLDRALKYALGIK